MAGFYRKYISHYGITYIVERFCLTTLFIVNRICINPALDIYPLDRSMSSQAEIMKLLIALYRGKDLDSGYIARSPDFPECMAEGKSIENALKNIEKKIRVEVRQEPVNNSIYNTEKLFNSHLNNPKFNEANSWDVIHIGDTWLNE